MAEDTFIVAELSANHGGDLGRALKTVEAVAASGADALKVQTYTPDTITINSDRQEFLAATRGTMWEGRTLYDLYREAHMPWEWHHDLKALADSLGLTFFSTPFDSSAVDFLEELGVELYKIASFEITDTPLIEYAAGKGKPMIISTGIAAIGDIQLAVDSCARVHNTDVTLLQCTSSYPSPAERANLLMIPSLSQTFRCKSGLSDHTLGSAVAVASVALGACVIEKHFTLDRSAGGPDATFSMEPDEFGQMVKDIRIAEKALGKVDYRLTRKKEESRSLARSLYVVANMVAGEPFTRENVRSIRPSGGLHPGEISKVLGGRASRRIDKGEPLTWNMIRPDDQS